MCTLELAHNISVNCRIGSLESKLDIKGAAGDVNCRIGSLEIQIYSSRPRGTVNCRIGSLERFDLV